MSKRVFLIVLDSFGIGAEPDAKAFGDEGVSTVRSCASSAYFDLPNLHSLGFFDIDGVAAQTAEGMSRRTSCEGTIMCYDAQDVKNAAMFGKCTIDAECIAKGKGIIARLQEVSMGKDTTIGHWEIAGICSEKPLPVYPDGFPKKLLDEFSKRTGRAVLCNKPYSGTKVIADYGDEHVETGALIVYTSADSVFQIAAHEDIVPVETLYEYCRIAREILKGEHGVGRVIARPFIGKSGEYTRTSRRHDYSIEPPSMTMLDQLMENGFDTISVGKIKDIFVGKGISEFVYTEGNTDGMVKTLEFADKDFNGLCFVNLVDFDMLYGHRRDIDGYAKALKEFDDFLPKLMHKMKEGDILMITADHGCDPGYTLTTDHTREYIPLVAWGEGLKNYVGDESRRLNLGTRKGYCDIGASVLAYFNIESKISGSSLI